MQELAHKNKSRQGSIPLTTNFLPLFLNSLAKVSSSKMNCPFESLFLEPSQEGVFFLELLVQQI